MKKIRIRCKGAGVLSVDKFLEFQGELKILAEENYQKLKADIEKNGFTEPISLWKDKKAKCYIANGHQRIRTVKRMIAEDGYECDVLPYSIVEADSLKQAKEILLSLASQYGTMTSQGLFDFAITSKIDPQVLAKRFAFPEINFDDFKIDFLSDKKKDPEPDKDGEVFDRTPEEYEQSVIKQIVLFFKKERYEDVLNKLETLRQKWELGDYSEVVGRLLDEEIGG